MIYYVDTSTRRHSWAAVQNAVGLAQSDAPITQLGPDDIVFVHETEVDLRRVSADLHAHTDSLDRIKAFRELLERLAGTGCEPYLVIYNGDGIGDKYAEAMVSDATKSAFPGYRTERIDVYKSGISSDIAAGRLREIVDAAASSAAAAFTRNGMRASSTADEMLQQQRASEATAALRLLCEALEACGGAHTGILHGIAINAPSSAREWFALFGLEPSEEAVASIAAMTNAPGPVTALLRAAMLGTAGEAARGFLAALGR